MKAFILIEKIRHHANRVRKVLTEPILMLRNQVRLGQLR